VPRDGGGTVRLADFAGRKLVLYFYPRADTSGCTREAVDFSRLKSAFSRAGTEILGISADPVAALDRFKSKHKLTVALASDEAHNVLDAYGVWQQKTLYGRKFIGIVRTTALAAASTSCAWPATDTLGQTWAIRPLGPIRNGFDLAAGCKSLTEAGKILAKSPLRFPNC